MQNLDTETIGKIIRETSGSGGYTNRALRLDRENTEAIELLNASEAAGRRDAPRGGGEGGAADGRARSEAAARPRASSSISTCSTRRVRSATVEFAEYPVAIGGAHSVIWTANYVARRWGV